MQPLWAQLAAKASLSLTDAQEALLERFIDLLLAANERMNLTRIVDRASAQTNHIGDALTLLPLLPCGEHNLVDVGSGGGVPGIPLAIMRPEIHIVLVEATMKKAAFLQETIRALALANVTVAACRAEAFGKAAGRAKFDVAVARALAPMDILVEWCLPMVKKGGKLLAMKGPKLAEELPRARQAIRLLGGGAPLIHPAQLPGAEGHVIVEIVR